MPISEEPPKNTKYNQKLIKLQMKNTMRKKIQENQNLVVNPYYKKKKSRNKIKKN